MWRLQCLSKLVHSFFEYYTILKTNCAVIIFQGDYILLMGGLKYK
jgi:hypothetical protein